VDALKGTGAIEGGVFGDIEEPCGLDKEEWTQSLAATKRCIAHGLAKRCDRSALRLM
jgi:hypothetical protein